MAAECAGDATGALMQPTHHLRNHTVLTALGRLLFPIMYGWRTGQPHLHRTRSPRAVFRVRPGTSDKLVVFETFGLRAYDDRRHRLEDQRVIVDIGAHIGDFSIYCARKAPAASIYAFEPWAPNFRLLVENLRLNGIDNVTAINQAMAGASGTGWLSVPNDNGAVGSLYWHDSRPGLAVQTTSLDDFFGNYEVARVDYL
jgi:FkbM family methyltransferase